MKVHRIVAKHFLDSQNGKNEVNHIDGNKLNNNADNLEWCTKSENIKHAHNTGLINNVGVNNGSCKFSVQDIHQIRSIYDQGWATFQELANAYKTSTSHISNIVNYKKWRHV